MMDLFSLMLAPADLVPGPTGCPIPGCKGIGHIKGAKYTGHHRYVQLKQSYPVPLQSISMSIPAPIFKTKVLILNILHTLCIF